MKFEFEKKRTKNCNAIEIHRPRHLDIDTDLHIQFIVMGTSKTIYDTKVEDKN